MNKILFSLALTLMTQSALACTPGVAGSGPHGDPNCMAPIFAQEQMMREQAQSYPSYNPSYNPSYSSGYYSAPDNWGAIAFRPDNSVIVAVNDQVTEGIARQRALKKCGYDDCKIAFAYKNAYAAVAIGDNDEEKGAHAFFFSDGDANVTKSGAMNDCKEHKRKNCRLVMFTKALTP